MRSDGGPPWDTAQTLKGLAYVAVTGAALYLLIYRACVAEERRTRELFLGNPSPMWAFDRQSLRFLAVNEAACRSYGYSPEEFAQMTVADILPQGGVAGLGDDLTRLRSEKPHVATACHRRKDGSSFVVRASAHAIEFDGHSAVMMLAQDISSEVALRDAVERSEARFHQLLDSLDEVLWMADLDGRSLYRSRAHEVVYGRTVAEFQADRGLWLRCVHPQDRDLAAASISQLHAQGHAESEYRIVRPDGAVRWLRDRKRLIYEQDRPVLMGGISYDVTERRAARAALKQMNETLEARVRERTAELEVANRDLEAFSFSAAHDLKTPLAAIRGVSQLLELQCGYLLDEKGRTLLGYLDRSARDMEGLIDALLGLCKVSRTEVQCRLLDLSSLAVGVLADINAKHPLQRARIEVQPDLHARGDPELVRSLLMNLLGNAVKYSSRVEAPLIEFGKMTEPPFAFFVRDNGAGFEVKDPERLFTPFQRFHSDREFQGSGVGLATCRRIVLRHGGDIWLTSAPGRGTTVFFFLEACKPSE
ncbi:PAS domain S-box protein [Aquabacterium sp. A7-Y]|uniref:sensor histidine kinase n=1 Tax=Aquabacterium sp. A7-Y TaxID=1349605 RepID=UPI00223CD7BD|nr:PAS domain S-box protein [Aquabacterium sp. A7-Y]MCW7539348.1 PAS domain S-box protein [Aquabacterium sp. A7-Y]